MREKIFKIIDRPDEKYLLSKIFNYFIISLIIVNALAVMLESNSAIHNKFKSAFFYFEIISVIIFTVEYLLRVWTADFRYPHINKVTARIKFIFSFYGLIDFLAVFPFYIPRIVRVDLRFIRILRLARMLRVLKLSRYSKSLNIIGEILNEKKTELGVAIFVTFLLLVFSASLMFYIENDAQPEAFPDMLSSLWWAIATLTTIGYGDVYPITGLGKLLSGIIAILGIGLVALPTGIFSGAFIEKIMAQRKRKETLEKKVCPHCGKEIN